MSIRYVLHSLNIGENYYWTAVLLSVGIWMLGRKMQKMKRAALSMLLPYLFLVAASTILSRGVMNDGHLILKPFWTIQSILTGGRQKAWLVQEVVLNILMLLPAGLLGPLLFEKKRLTKTVLLGMGTSIMIEIVQLIFHRGYAEIDDLVFNLMDVMGGYGIFLLLRKSMKPGGNVD